MPRFTYVGPFDVVDVPLLGRTLTAGEEFDATDDQAAILAAQPDNYQPVTTKAAKADTAPEG